MLIQFCFNISKPNRVFLSISGGSDAGGQKVAESYFLADNSKNDKDNDNDKKNNNDEKNAYRNEMIPDKDK
jgi:hypothetical protein